MADLKLTVIVPLYNSVALVSRCLESIVCQEIPADEYEVIVVDDGSTDGGGDVVDDFSRNHPQVKVIHQPNAGVSAARNRAIAMAKGRFLQFVDADDYLVEGTMSQLLQRAIDLDVEVLVFNYHRVDDKLNILAIDENDFFSSMSVMTGVQYLSSHVMTPYVWRFLLRRDFLVQGNWRFNESLVVCEDGVMIANFLLHAARVAQDDSAPYCYVLNSTSAMHNPDPQHLRRRIFSQIDAAASIDDTIKRYEAQTGQAAPASVAGLRNVYLYFSMTKALTCGIVDDAVQRISQRGMFPFPCVGPEAHYHGAKWKIIHALMMKPALWKLLSKLYRMLK